MTDVQGNWIPSDQEDGNRDGGSVFGYTAEGDKGRPWHMPGNLSLRDYFAANVLANYDSAALGEWDIHGIAADCYRLADAMLKARKEQRP